MSNLSSKKRKEESTCKHLEPLWPSSMSHQMLSRSFTQKSPVPAGMHSCSFKVVDSHPSPIHGQRLKNNVWIAHLLQVVEAVLEDFDVVFSPSITAYGACPATLAESPGTHVAVHVNWLTPKQLDVSGKYKRWRHARMQRHKPSIRIMHAQITGRAILEHKSALQINDFRPMWDAKALHHCNFHERGFRQLSGHECIGNNMHGAHVLHCCVQVMHKTEGAYNMCELSGIRLLLGRCVWKYLTSNPFHASSMKYWAWSH